MIKTKSKMAKFHIKKDDQVIVLAGSDKGRSGKVLKVLVDKERVLVEGINMVSKSTKPSAANPQPPTCAIRAIPKGRIPSGVPKRCR